MVMEKNKLKNKKILVFSGLLMVSLFSFVLVRAKDNSFDYFQDRDQDGLTDQEEKALGTDWKKADTDGDGYSDGVEVKNGFNPLVPAPGDRLTPEENQKVREVVFKKQHLQKNLTQEFIEKLKAKKEGTLEAFKEASGESGVVVDLDSMKRVKSLSLTNKDIEEIVRETMQDSSLGSEMKLLPESDFKILPKVTAKSERKKKEKIKKELEDYVAQVGYIMVKNLPFQLDEGDEFAKKLDKFMVGVGDDIVMGDDLRVKESRARLSKTFQELKEIEIPYVVKDVHIRILSLMNYLLEQDEDIVFQKDDPVAMALLVGRLQGILSDIQAQQIILEDILEKYGVVDSQFKSVKEMEDVDYKNDQKNK